MSTEDNKIDFFFLLKSKIERINGRDIEDDVWNLNEDELYINRAKNDKSEANLNSKQKICELTNMVSMIKKYKLSDIDINIPNITYEQLLCIVNECPEIVGSHTFEKFKATELLPIYDKCYTNGNYLHRLLRDNLEQNNPYRMQWGIDLYRLKPQHIELIISEYFDGKMPLEFFNMLTKEEQMPLWSSRFVSDMLLNCSMKKEISFQT